MQEPGLAGQRLDSYYCLRDVSLLRVSRAVKLANNYVPVVADQVPSSPSPSNQFKDEPTTGHEHFGPGRTYSPRAPIYFYISPVYRSPSPGVYRWFLESWFLVSSGV